MAEKLFVAGASARSAVQSAARAGMEVVAADLFCDRDLTACGRGHQVHRFPDDIQAVARNISPRRWMYTGGLENSAKLVDSVSRRHLLLGNSAEVLRRVRDPWCVQQALRDSGLLAPDLLNRPPVDSHVRWLCKPKKSCGGARIRFWSAPECRQVDQAAGGRNRPHSDSLYYQRYVEGQSLGALYVAASRKARLLGVTRQLVGSPWLGACEFLYLGSVGPIVLEQNLIHQFRRIGECLAAAFDLSGLFGVDAIVQASGVWAIEVNPRFTASVEIHERAARWCAVSTHWKACENSILPADELVAEEVHGKSVVYAMRSGVVQQRFCDWIDAQNDSECFPLFADIPVLGARITVGAPIVTAMAHGRLASDVCHILRARSSAAHAEFNCT